MIYCKDCRHLVTSEETCSHPSIIIKDVVRGPSPVSAKTTREHGLCGMDARFFEAIAPCVDEVAEVAARLDEMNPFFASITAPRKRGRPRKIVANG